MCRGDIAKPGVHQAGALTERLMAPVGAATMAWNRKNRHIPMRSEQTSALIVRHRTVGIAWNSSAERLIDHARLGPRALPWDWLRRRCFLPWLLWHGRSEEHTSEL